jgi:beta-galactosidase
MINKLMTIYLLFLVLCLMMQSWLFAQPEYTIDITKQDYTLNTGFIKTGSSKSPSGEILSYNNLYLTRNGKPWFPVMGEMHFSQNEQKDWENSILKMKACGIEIISIYIFWIHHEETEGALDWRGNRNLRKFLSLCKKHNMYVWLRPGPWIHAEARNGGFPDWLQHKPIKLRTNDSTYLVYAKKWFADIAAQCYGYWYKQSGTIIGVQLENEMEFKDAAHYRHMKTLKQLAIETGMDVPYYSAFAQGPDNQGEFLYTLGGYADSPWGQHTKKMYKPVFFIKPLEADSDIGSDLFGSVDTKVRNTYPKLSAELGSGMQKTYHRRVDVSSKDVGATSFTRVASGLNGMGYFMFQGGMNPVGKTTTSESRVTGYPNDMPHINYDFQAPIGAMDMIRESYNELKLLNLFLQDYGEILATQKAFFPKQRVATYFSYDTVQASVRVHNNSGFIFLSNYQRFVDMPTANSLQLHLQTTNGEVSVPEKPVSFTANSYAVWPYNLNMQGAILKYATAHPLCILHNAENTGYIFFTDNDAEFVFDNTGIGSYHASYQCTGSTNDKNTHINILKNTTAAFDIITADKKKISVLVLPREKALQAYKINYQNREVLVISDDNITWYDNKLMIEHISDNPATTLSIYPAIKLTANAKTFTLSPVKIRTPFVNYSITAHAKQKASVSITEDSSWRSNAAAVNNAERYRDSILEYYATSKKFNKLQPGPVYQYQFHNLPSQHLYDIKFNAPVNSLVKDWIADIQYQGDVMALYKNDTLLYDQFNYDNHCSYKLSYALLKPADKLKLQVLPLQNEYDIYVEDRMLEAKQKDWLKGVLENIKLTPLYWFEVDMK